jgi:elongation factor P|uniref:Elongation factor P n=1 Tax=candidate division WOR-3 bacterium TaxID=2052148 RepID=A0A7V3PSH6_UNCW3
MVTPNDFRTGLLIKYNNEIFEILSYSRTRTAQRRARVLTKMRNIRTGALIEESFESEIKLETVEMERRKGQYLYADDSGYHFMDLETYDQFALKKEVLGDKVLYLTEGLEVEIGYIEGVPMMIEPPMFIVLEVIETEPNYRGDTATGGGKPARLSTGLMVDVPFFIKVGDRVRIDTRTNTYVERA